MRDTQTPDTIAVLVMGKSGQVRKAWRVIVAKDQGPTQAPVMIGVHVALATVLNIDKCSQVQEGAIQEVDAPADEAN